MSEQRIADDLGVCIHAEAVQWIAGLLIDLKKQLLGYPVSRAITMERLKEFEPHYRDLLECRQPMHVDQESIP